MHALQILLAAVKSDVQAARLSGTTVRHIDVAHARQADSFPRGEELRLVEGHEGAVAVWIGRRAIEVLWIEVLQQRARRVEAALDDKGRLVLIAFSGRELALTREPFDGHTMARRASVIVPICLKVQHAEGPIDLL